MLLQYNYSLWNTTVIDTFERSSYLACFINYFTLYLAENYNKHTKKGKSLLGAPLASFVHRGVGLLLEDLQSAACMIAHMHASVNVYEMDRTNPYQYVFSSNTIRLSL